MNTFKPLQPWGFFYYINYIYNTIIKYIINILIEIQQPYKTRDI